MDALIRQEQTAAQPSTRLLQESGIKYKYKYNLSLPVGSRITKLALASGTPILPDATTYTITCNEFIATGGDGFTVFLSGTNVTRIGISDLDALTVNFFDKTNSFDYAT